MSLFYHVIILILSAFVLCVLLTRLFIPFLKKKKLGQTILSIGPAWHKSKEGTPTMGGIVFILLLPPLAVIGSFQMDGRVDQSLIFVLLFALANGFIGLIDDGTKLKNKRNLGLLPWQKLFLQSLFVGGFLFLMHAFAEDTFAVRLPFFNLSSNGGILVLFFSFVFLLGIVNCVNLSDGIDGLTASSSLLIALFLLAEGVLSKSISLIALGSVTTGTMLGFLLFNAHPAKIFMGDTGSLFLGALLAGGGFLTENPAILPIYTLLFLIEGLSVMLQVFVFKRTGKRLFLMAPLHHHLEKHGWSERKIVLVFSFITLLSCLFAHLALIWR